MENKPAINYDIRLIVSVVSGLLLIQPWIVWSASIKAILTACLWASVQLYCVSKFPDSFLKEVPFDLSIGLALYSLIQLFTSSSPGTFDAGGMIVNRFVPLLSTMCARFAQKKQ